MATLDELKENKNKVVVVVQGGLVTDVYSANKNLDVLVLDLDNNDEMTAADYETLKTDLEAGRLAAVY